MMRIACDICDKFLKEQGALIFTPPVLYQVIKVHVCVKCWKKISKKLNIQEQVR